MTEPRTQPERIDLAQADDPRDVVHRAVACLAQGGIVGLATETVYNLAASALRPEAVVRLRRIKNLDPADPLTLFLRGADEAADWVPQLSTLGRRLARRAWPGPVTLVFPGPFTTGLSLRLPEPVRPLIFPDASVSLRVPAQPFVREVLRLLPAPIVVAQARRPDTNEVATTADDLADRPDIDMIVDAGPTHFRTVSTVVQVDDDHWRVMGPGAVDEAALTRMAGTIYLFVCTGNTCRSPMAEALCKVLLARRLGCPLDELAGRGHVVLSAGVAAINGMPAAAHAVEVVRARGGSLQQHGSRKLAADLVRHADLIVAMTNDHLEELLAQAPDCAPRARLLHPEGGDVADPVGADRATYQRTAREIEGYLERLLDEIGV